MKRKIFTTILIFILLFSAFTTSSIAEEHYTSTSSYTNSNSTKKPKYANLKELENSKDLIFASVIGSIDIDIVNSKYPDCKCISYPTLNDCVASILAGKTNFTLTEYLAGLEFINYNDGIAMLNESIYDQQIGAIFPKDNEFSNKIKEDFNEYIRINTENNYISNTKQRWLDNLTDNTMPKQEFSGTKILVAINPTTPPYLYISEDGYAGFEIEIFEDFCSKYNYIPEYINVDFAGLLTFITADKADIALSEIAITEERAKSVDFSDPYTTEGLYPLVPTEGVEDKTLFSKIKTSITRTLIDESRWKMVVNGILTTLEITILSGIFGTVIGFVIYLLCIRNNKVLTKFFNVFSRIFNGLPMVVILMILYYIIFRSSKISGTFVAIVGFSISVALSVYSNLKDSVLSIGTEQIQGARSLGFTDIQIFNGIILPQALQQFIPRYKGEIITLINGTAVVGFIAVQDLTKMTDLIRARTYEAFFPLISTAIIYFLLGVLLTYLVNLIQIKFDPTSRSEKRVLQKYKL